jgi:serine/threonine protein kinase
MIQIVKGLLYLHAKSICHFDIKARGRGCLANICLCAISRLSRRPPPFTPALLQLGNILLDEHKVPKLCDTGLARILEASAISSGKPPALPARPGLAPYAACFLYTLCVFYINYRSRSVLASLLLAAMALLAAWRIRQPRQLSL